MTIIFLLVALVVIFLVTILLQGGPARGNENFTNARGSVNQLSSRDREEILELLRQGKKIQAIKTYRSLTGCGLKEAKNAVEQLGPKN